MNDLFSTNDILRILSRCPCGVVVYDPDTDGVLFANTAALRVAQAVGQLPVIAFGPMDPYPTGAQLFGNSLKEKRISHPGLEHDYEVTSEPTDWKGLPATLYYLLPVLG